MLRVNFGGIYGNVRHLLITRIGRLGGRYCKTKDPAIKAEIDRLNAELAKLPTQWKFVSRRSGEESFSTALPCYFGRMTEIQFGFSSEPLHLRVQKAIACVRSCPKPWRSQLRISIQLPSP